MLNYKLSILLLFLSISMVAQNEIPIGQWRTHLPFNRMLSVTQSDTKVYYGAEQMVVQMDKVEKSITRLDRVNGLSDVEVQVIKYYRDKELLVVAYANGNIDIIDENGTVNISDIKRTSLVTNKTFNHIHFNGDFAYISCDFGLVQIDVTRFEIKDTYLTPDIPVNASYVLNGDIFMATDDGIYQGKPDVNLLDFNNWIRHGNNKNLVENYYSNVMEYFDGRLFADVNDTLMFFQNDQWNHFPSRLGLNSPLQPYFYNENQTNKHLETSLDGNRMMITMTFNVAMIAADGYCFKFSNPDFLSSPRQAVRDGDQTWYADYNTGANHIDAFAISSVEINAPFSKNVREITVADNEVYVASGGVDDRWRSTLTFDGMFSLVEGQWAFLNTRNSDSLTNTYDFLSVAKHPENGKVYIGTFNKGLIETLNNEVLGVYNQNSSLQTPILDPSSYRVGSLAFDTENRLWMTNYQAPRPISVLKKNGEWKSFSVPSSFNQLDQMVIDFNGYKWCVNAGGQGIVVFNDNGTIDNTSDDAYRILTTSNSDLPTNDINCLALDVDGNIWVGTRQGTMVFECTGSLFEQEGCFGRKIVVEEDDFGAHLLATENVKTIAVDGGNRKWFGTENGIFVQSSDAETTILRLTTENSPLLSNNINDIAINPNDGEVFIGTDQGIISYRGEATQGSSFHGDTEVYAFPNPVRPDYKGPIAIRGLVEDANVKITDVNGTLIYQTVAIGGQAIWDGNDYNGRRAASGVYLVFSARRDGLDSIVTKILIVN